jgi:hypothetical protein
LDHNIEIATQSIQVATMRRVLAAATMMAILTGSAYAQANMTGAGPKDPLRQKYEEEAKHREQVEKDYNATMKRLKAQGPTTTTNSDPWRGVRPADDSTAKR